MSGPSTDDASDMNFKMSKKIAQLTKVIYQLNCRNEDGDVVAKNIAERYESEISLIMVDAKEKLTSLRDALNAKNNDDKIQRVIKEMTKLHQKEKDEATRMFDEFRERVLRNEQSLKQNFEDRVAAMTRELAQSKEDFAKALKELRESSAASSASGKKELEDIIAKKTKEMDDLVKEYNERYKAMLAEQLDAQDQLEKKLNDEWRKKVEALQAQLNGKTTDLSKLLSEEQAKCSALERELVEVKKELDVRQKTIESRDAEATKLRQRVEHFESMNANIAVQLKASEERCASQGAKILAVEAELSEAQGFLADERKSAADLRARFEKLGADHTCTVNELSVAKQTIASLEGQLKDLLAEKERLGELGSNMGSEVEQLSNKIRTLTAALEEERQRATKAETSLVSSQEARRVVEEELSKTRRDWEDEVAALRRGYDDKLASLQNASSSSSDAMAQRHKEALDALRAQLEKDKEGALTALAANHKSTIAGLEQHHSEAMGKAKWAHEKTLAAEAERAAREKTDLEKQIAELREKLSGDASHAQKELETLRKELATLKQSSADAIAAKEAELRSLGDAHASSLAALNAQLADANQNLAKERAAKEAEREKAAEVPVLKAKLAALEAAHAQELSALAARHQKALDDATQGTNKEAADRMRQEMERLQRELHEKHEREKAKLVADQKISMDAVTSEAAKAAKEAERAAQAAAERITALQKELDALQRSIQSNNDAASTLRETLQRELELARKAHQDDIDALKRKHEEALLQQHQSLQLAHTTDVASLTARHDKAVQELEAKLLALGDDARLAQRDMEENFKNRVASLEKRKDEERERVLREQEARAASDMAQLVAAHNKETDDMRQAKHVVEREVTALTSEVAGLKEKLARLSERLDAEVHARQQREAEWAQEKAMLNQTHKDALGSAAKAHGDELERLKTAHEDKLTAMTTQHDTEKKQLHAKIKQLQKMVADLEYKYANRESRQEDVEKINQLLRETKEKDDALIKAFNDMKFYKLELHNREENFNKMFGRQPSVANMSGAAAADTNALPSSNQQMSSSVPTKPNVNPSSAPSKMENASMPPNMRRKTSIAADK